MDKEKRIRTAGAEFTWCRLSAIWKSYGVQYIAGQSIPPVSVHWPTEEELKVFERIIDEVRHEALVEARTTCFRLFADDYTKTTPSDVWNRLYREVFSEIASPDHPQMKERVNEKESSKPTGDHQDRERAVKHPAEKLSAPTHRGKRRGRRGPDTE